MKILAGKSSENRLKILGSFVTVPVPIQFRFSPLNRKSVLVHPVQFAKDGPTISISKTVQFPVFGSVRGLLARADPTA